MEKVLTALCNSYNVSGNELEDFEIIKSFLPENADVETDCNGNIIATIGNKNSNDIIMLDAHNDRIGFVVTYIDDKGFLKIANCGGIDRRVILGSIVTVMGSKKLKGIICCLPPHLSDGGEDKAPSADSIYVDVGLSKEDVEKYVTVGDKVAVVSKPRKLLNNNFTASGIDNKAGVAALIKTANILANENIKSCVKILFSSQEETGFLGSRTGAFSISPSCAIVVDVTFATQAEVDKTNGGTLNENVMIGLSPILDKEMYNDFKRIAERENIKYEIEVMSSTTGTNADAITISKGGIKTALISIPERNMHTQAEIVDIKSIENTAKLIAEYIKERCSVNE